jgi:hypothetical protein
VHSPCCIVSDYIPYQIEDASYGVGGWGESTKHTTRIKERRIVLCVDNATLPVVGAGKSAAGKIKFRKINNGAGIGSGYLDSTLQCAL